MALLRSVCQSGRLSHYLKPQQWNSVLMQTRTVTIRASPAPEPVVLTHEAKNRKLGRPMSPHLLIYRPQLTSMMSISHRITGMALTFYASVLAGSSLMGADVATYLAEAGIPAPVAFVGKFVIAFPFAYHLMNGVRHLTWDIGMGLTIKEVYMTGYVVLLLTTLFSIYLASLKPAVKK